MRRPRASPSVTASTSSMVSRPSSSLRGLRAVRDKGSARRRVLLWAQAPGAGNPSCRRSVALRDCLAQQPLAWARTLTNGHHPAADRSLRRWSALRDEGHLGLAEEEEAPFLSQGGRTLGTRLGRIRRMRGLPRFLNRCQRRVIVKARDQGSQHVNIPVIAGVDTNCDPIVDYVIAGNERHPVDTGGVRRSPDGEEGARHAQGVHGRSGVVEELARNTAGTRKMATRLSRRVDPGQAQGRIRPVRRR